MEKNNETSNPLFEIFFLREQLHNYLDILEPNKYRISRCVAHGNASSTLENKRLMVGLAEKIFHRHLKNSIQDAAIFHPPRQMWLNESEISECDSCNGMKEILLNFDKKIMVWCYLSMVNEEVDIELSGFFLVMVQYAKADTDLIKSEFKK